MVPVHAVPSGHASEQALENGGTVATARPMPVAAQKPHIVHKDKHHCCWALLLKASTLMRSCSRRKQSGRHQPLRFSVNVCLSRKSQTATQHRPTSRSGISPALGEIAANVISPIRGTAAQHPSFGGAEHGVLGDDSFTPLELAACAHLANTGMHWELFALVGESHPCRISAATEPSAPEIATTAFALFILSPASMSRDGCRGIGFSVRLLTALCMHSLRMGGACTTMAFLLPTFGKRPQEERGAARERTATMTPTSAEMLGDSNGDESRDAEPWDLYIETMEAVLKKDIPAVWIWCASCSGFQTHKMLTLPPRLRSPGSKGNAGVWFGTPPWMQSHQALELALLPMPCYIAFARLLQSMVWCSERGLSTRTGVWLLNSLATCSLHQKTERCNEHFHTR